MKNINEQILNSLAEGLTVKEISNSMFLTIHSIKKRLRDLRKKFDAKNTTELIAKYIKSSQKIPY